MLSYFDLPKVKEKFRSFLPARYFVVSSSIDNLIGWRPISASLGKKLGSGQFWKCSTKLGTAYARACENVSKNSEAILDEGRPVLDRMTTVIRWLFTATEDELVNLNQRIIAVAVGTFNRCRTANSSTYASARRDARIPCNAWFSVPQRLHKRSQIVRLHFFRRCTVKEMEIFELQTRLSSLTKSSDLPNCQEFLVLVAKYDLPTNSPHRGLFLECPRRTPVPEWYFRIVVSTG